MRWRQTKVNCQRRLHTSRGKVTLTLAIAVAVVAASALGLSRWQHAQAGKTAEAAGEESSEALPTVTYTLVKRGDSSASLALPASLHPYQETTIFSRATGYVKRVAVDIGAKVKKGDFLAEIDAPETDREIEQIQANQRQIQSKLELAQTIAERYRRLGQENAVSKQDLDERNGAVKVLQADLGATHAQIKRLQQMKTYQQIVAPFSGTIAARNIDVGAMIIAGSSTNSIWLFKLMQTDTLRVTVNVPQSHMKFITAGMEAELQIPELADKKFPGRVARNAAAFDPATRTIATELEVANGEGVLAPGMYGQVKFHLTNDRPPLVVPVASVLVRGDGAQALIVGAGDQLQVRKIKLGRDLGKSIEVLEGLAENDKIVINPRDNAADGLKIKAVAIKQDAAKEKTADPKAKPIIAVPPRS